MTYSNRFLHATLVFVASQWLFPVSTRADIVVSQLQLDIYNYGIDSVVPVGQSFTAVSNKLLGFDFYFLSLNPGGPNDPITLDIRQGAGTGGTILATSQFTLPVIDRLGSTWGGLSFSLDVTAGQQYTATLEANSPYWGFWYTSLNPYSGGQAYFNKPDWAPEAWPNPADADLMFRATFADQSTTVPDAANTLSLMALSLAGIALLRRRFVR